MKHKTIITAAHVHAVKEYVPHTHLMPPLPYKTQDHNKLGWPSPPVSGPVGIMSLDIRGTAPGPRTGGHSSTSVNMTRSAVDILNGFRDGCDLGQPQENDRKHAVELLEKLISDSANLVEDDSSDFCTSCRARVNLIKHKVIEEAKSSQVKPSQAKPSQEDKHNQEGQSTQSSGQDSVLTLLCSGQTVEVRQTRPAFLQADCRRAGHAHPAYPEPASF